MSELVRGSLLRNGTIVWIIKHEVHKSGDRGKPVLVVVTAVRGDVMAAVMDIVAAGMDVADGGEILGVINFCSKDRSKCV